MSIILIVIISWAVGYLGARDRIRHLERELRDALYRCQVYESELRAYDILHEEGEL